jgi:competence ComEA-like helix-hairpin-helix protein
MKTERSNILITYAEPSKFLLLIFLCFSQLYCVRSHTNQHLEPSGGKLSLNTAIDINSASVEELKKLPTIGDGTARKIIEHREKYGRFRKAEHLLLIEGISEEKFEKIQNMVTVN